MGILLLWTSYSLVCCSDDAGKMKYTGTWHPSTHLDDVAARPARELDYANSKEVK